MIVSELKSKSLQMREIDLSYNRLYFSEDLEGTELYQDSVAFIDGIKKLFKMTKLLNHVNFAGMNITGKYMFDLCQALSACSFILGIHLCDNGLYEDEELFLEILNLFGLSASDIPIQQNLTRHQKGHVNAQGRMN